MTELRCSRCGGSMERCDAIEAAIAGCGRCGGLWIDHAAGAALLEGSMAEEIEAFVAAFDAGSEGSGADDGAYRTAQPAATTCPTCGRSLSRLVIEGQVEVDSCEAHGTFFDRHELKAFRFARAAGTAAEGARAQRTEAEFEHFEFDVRAPSARVRRRFPLFSALRELFYDLQHRS